MSGPAQAPDALRTAFLEGMSYAAATVSVVATDGPAGRAGVTVSAMASVSVEGPAPQLLVCIHHKSPACEKILRNGVFTLNILRESQHDVSDTFAGRAAPPGGDKFNVGQWIATELGAPSLADALVSFACTLDQSVEVGTHHVLFGAARAVSVAGGDRPLIYANRSYGVPAALLPPLQSDASGERLGIATFAPFAPYIVPQAVAELVRQAPGINLRLIEGDDGDVRRALMGGQADVGVLYRFGVGPDFTTRPLGTLAPYVLLPALHPLATADRLPLTALTDEPLVLLDIEPSRHYAVSLFEAADLTPTIRWRVKSFEMVRGLVGHGLGYAILATKPANNVTYDGRALAVRPLKDMVRGSEVVAALPTQRPPSAAAVRFVELLEAQFCGQP